MFTVKQDKEWPFSYRVYKGDVIANAYEVAAIRLQHYSTNDTLESVNAREANRVVQELIEKIKGDL